MNALPGNKQTSAKTLIDAFEYPRLGAGMMWEKARDEVIQCGGRVCLGRTVNKFERQGNTVLAVSSQSLLHGRERWPADEFTVSMPLRDCVLSMDQPFGNAAQDAARQLSYRDFILVVLVVNRADLFPDQWIYVHAPEVKVARIENFNNWGGGMNSTPNTTCLATEYFCNCTDAFWQKSDAEIAEVAGREMGQLGLARSEEILDAHVVWVEKAYPVYDHNYRKNVTIIRRGLAGLVNLQVAGRNGMHKYNNQDHSMLTGRLAAQNLNGNRHDLWRVNTDAQYQEEEPTDDTAGRLMPQTRR